MKRAGWAVLALLVAGASAAQDGGAPGEAQPLGFASRVRPEKVRLGEPFTYELTITHRLDQRYELRPIREPGPFEPLEQLRNRVDGSRDATTTFKLKLSLFELGKKRLPDLIFDVVDPTGAREFLVTGIEVETLSSLPKDADQREPSLFDIKALEEIPVRTYRVLWVALALAAAAMLGYGIYRWWVKRRPAPAGQQQRVPEPLNVRTLRALDALRQEDLSGQGRFREFYFQLSEILRSYLGEHYGFEALECTSSELLDALRRRPTPGLAIAELSTFVESSDLVKFAKAGASPIQCKESLEFAYRLVHASFSPIASPVFPDAHRVHVP